MHFLWYGAMALTFLLLISTVWLPDYITIVLEVVDLDALIEALREKIIWGAGLDVMYPEPLPSTHPLTTLPNCGECSEKYCYFQDVRLVLCPCVNINISCLVFSRSISELKNRGWHDPHIWLQALGSAYNNISDLPIFRVAF